MQRSPAWAHIQRMSSSWHVMHLVCSHQWASWVLRRPCTISLAATLLLCVLNTFFLDFGWPPLIWSNGQFRFVWSKYVLIHRWLGQRMEWKNRGLHSQLALELPLLCCTQPSMLQCWLRRCRSRGPLGGLLTPAGQVEGIDSDNMQVSRSYQMSLDKYLRIVQIMN